MDMMQREFCAQIMASKGRAEDLTWQQRVSSALAAFDDLPEQLADVLRQRAVSIADDIQGAVAPVHHAICGSEDLNESCITQSLASLEAIPYYIYTTFDRSFKKAKGAARHRVEELTRHLEGSDMGSEHICAELWAIPEEMQQIAADATDEAVLESQVMIMRLLDFALQPLPEWGVMHPDVLTTVKQELVAKVPKVYPYTVKAAHAAATSNVEHAIAAVRDLEAPQTLSNRAVMDALLRAKAEKLNPPEWAEARALESTPSESEATADAHARQLDGSGENKSPSDCPLIYADAHDLHQSMVSFASGKCASAPAVMGGLRWMRATAGSTASTPLTSTSLSDKGSILRSCSSAVLASAVAAIDVIPEQLVEVLQLRAGDLVAGVEADLEVVRQALAKRQSVDLSSVIAVKSLEAIPEMIMTSFQEKLVRVKMIVRQAINRITQRLHENSHLASEDIVSQLWCIPEEVQQIAFDAVGEAVQESQQQATRQLDHALEQLPGNAVLFDARVNIMERVPDNCLVDVARATVEANVGNAVAAVAPETSAPSASQMHWPVDTGVRDFEPIAGTEAVSFALGLQACCAGPRGVDRTDESGVVRTPLPLLAPNPAAASAGSPQVKAPPRVKEELLASTNVAAVDMSRSEASGHVDGGRRDDAVPSAPAPAPLCTNPGSLGHPELCPRPCLYYPVGQCTNGSNCEFCHMPHPKRPAHLDKRHRETLKTMSFRECLCIMYPILKGKVDSLPPEVLQLLDALGAFGQSPPTQDTRQLKESRLLHSALSAMSLRSLLTTLHRSALSEASPERSAVDAFRKAIDNVLQRLREESQ